MVGVYIGFCFFAWIFGRAPPFREGFALTTLWVAMSRVPLSLHPPHYARQRRAPLRWPPSAPFPALTREKKDVFLFLFHKMRNKNLTVKVHFKVYDMKMVKVN